MAFENLSQSLQRLGQEAGSKLQSIMETAAVSSKISEAKKELERSYSEFGKAAYEKSFGEPIDLADFSELPKSERTQVVLDTVMSRIFELRDSAPRAHEG